MADSLALSLVKALASRLTVIQIANGYQTDAGLRVYRGKIDFDWLDSAQFPVLSVIDSEELCDPEHNERCDNTMSLYVEGHAVADPANPADTGHALIADIKQALFIRDDQNVGGLAAGMEYLGRQMQMPDSVGRIVSVRIALEVTYPELYGDPYTVI